MSRRNKNFSFDDFVVDPRFKKPFYITGKLTVNIRGFGFVIPDVKESPKDVDVFISPEEMGSALHGDRVKVRITDEYGGRREGEIVEVLERANKIIVGTVKKKKNKYYVVPDDSRLDLKISLNNAEGFDNLHDVMKSKLKVTAEIFSWNPVRGKLLEILGKKSDPGVDVLSIIRSFGVIDEFPEEVQEAANKIETSPSEEEISRRIDRRNLKIVTIDGEDAKDLDDGVFAEPRGDGFFLGVYIADVSYYVRRGNILDKEAFERGTSIYPVDRVVPMLPKELSNGICSLNANVDRLAMACEMELDSFGKVVNFKIFPTAIHVHRRLSYTQVNKFLDGDTSELADCADNLNTLKKIFDLRKKIRTARGSIDFELPEMKISLDENGKPVEVTKKIRGVAEMIVEECMLAANETVAEYTQAKKIPSLYRVHELPTAEKIDTLNLLLAHFGLHLTKTSGEEKIQPKDFQKILDKVKGIPLSGIISGYALRTMQQARYSSENLGHFGLAAKFYTHFTSPIRRYPDLIVHRMLRTALESPKDLEKFGKSLDEIALQSSERERRAVEIERETVSLKSVEYMSQFVGQKFDGIISSITGFGFFVELENGIDGLVRVADIPGDYYVFVEREFALIGHSTGKSFRIGDSVRVKLIEADVKLHRLTFELVAGVAAKDLIANGGD